MKTLYYDFNIELCIYWTKVSNQNSWHTYGFIIVVHDCIVMIYNSIVFQDVFIEFPLLVVDPPIF